MPIGGDMKDAEKSGKENCRDARARKRFAAALRDLSKRKREAAREAILQKAKQREDERCGGGSLVSFVIKMRYGFNPSRARGCVIDIGVATVISTTQDGWLMVAIPGDYEASAALSVIPEIHNRNTPKCETPEVSRRREVQQSRQNSGMGPTFSLLGSDGGP